MTRLLGSRGRTAQLRRGRFDVAEAFKFLGTGPSHRQLACAADLLRESGLEDLVYDAELVTTAEKNGSSGIDALDLHVVFHGGIAALTAGPRGGRAEA